ncbi:MAG: tRNA pseudouridine(38-40) synthase TruA [Spirochaetia bacterium]
MKRNIKITLSYDGKDFAGWQIQKNDRTVQGEIESCISRLLKQDIRITPAGRTDSGVHANGQVINFHTENTSIPARKFAVALNSLLPQDIRCLSSTAVSPDFHARYWAYSRTYKYKIIHDRPALPHEIPYALFQKDFVDIKTLNSLASILLGTHDFTSFAAAGDPHKNKVRTIDTSYFYYEGRYLVYKIRSRSFLWKQVRTIVGTILEYAKEGLGQSDLFKVLELKNRKHAGKTAAPGGLYLEKVDYDE